MFGSDIDVDSALPILIPQNKFDSIKTVATHFSHIGFKRDADNCIVVKLFIVT